MSQLSTGALDLGQRRSNPNIGAERTGITESLGAPGVTPIGPQSASANQLAQFDRALGLTGQVVEQIVRVSRREKAVQDRLEHGLAYVDVSTDLSKDMLDAEDRGPDFFAELEDAGQSIEDHADVVFDFRTEGRSEAYKTRYMQTFKPRYVAALRQRRANLEDENRFELIGKLGNSLAAATGDPDEMRAVLDSMAVIDPSMSEDERKEPLVAIGMEAAARGDAQGVKSVFEVLDGSFQLDQDRIARTLGNAEERVHAIQERDFEEIITARIASGAPTEMVEKMIEGHRDRFRTDLTPERLIGKLRARDAGQVQSEQQEHLNNSRLSVGLGIYPGGDPNLAATQIITDMARPSTDPAFIPATSGLELLRKMETQLKTNAYRTAVESKLSGDSTLPLSASYDTAIDQALADRGIIDGPRSDNGQVLVRSIEDPQKLAYASDVAGRVTGSVSQAIASGLAGDAQDAAASAEAYAALYKQNPALAAQVMQSMGDEARLRARFIETRLPHSEKPWTDRAFMQIKPVEIERDTLRSVLWSGNRRGFVKDSDVSAKSRDAIRGFVNDTEFHDTFRFGFGRHFAPISGEHADEYGKILEEEFRFALSLTANESQAIELAKTNSQSRFLASNPPVIWDGEIMLTSSQQATSPNFQAIITQDLKESGWTDDAVDNLVENYRPAWDEESRAWMFVDDNGLRYIYSTKEDVGLTLLVDPFAPKEVISIEDQGRKWEEDARQQREATERRPRVDTNEIFSLDGELIEGIP